MLCQQSIGFLKCLWYVASGGRIGRLDHGSIAMSLIRAAEKAKKGHNTTTQSLLEQPDEAITKALAIADEALS